MRSGTLKMSKTKKQKPRKKNYLLPALTISLLFSGMVLALAIISVHYLNRLESRVIREIEENPHLAPLKTIPLDEMERASGNLDNTIETALQETDGILPGFLRSQLSGWLNRLTLSDWRRYAVEKEADTLSALLSAMMADLQRLILLAFLALGAAVFAVPLLFCVIIHSMKRQDAKKREKDKAAEKEGRILL